MSLDEATDILIPPEEATPATTPTNYQVVQCQMCNVNPLRERERERERERGETLKHTYFQYGSHPFYAPSSHVPRPSEWRREGPGTHCLCTLQNLRALDTTQLH